MFSALLYCLALALEGSNSLQAVLGWQHHDQLAAVYGAFVHHLYRIAWSVHMGGVFDMHENPPRTLEMLSCKRFIWLLSWGTMYTASDDLSLQLWELGSLLACWDLKGIILALQQHVVAAVRTAGVQMFITRSALLGNPGPRQVLLCLWHFCGLHAGRF